VSWLRIDDGFAEHPKVVELSDRAFRLHVAALCFCTRNLTDGVLSDRSVKVVCALTSSTKKHVGELREAGLWIAIPDGFTVKDFLEYNPSAEKVKEDRASARERMRKLRSPERSREHSVEQTAHVRPPRPVPEEPTQAVTPLRDIGRATEGDGTASDFQVPELLQVMP
jgi:hypothetical protein